MILPWKHISKKQLLSAINNGAQLVDVRSPDEYSQKSLPGAVNIPLDTLPRHLSRFNGMENIIVFSNSGKRSSRTRVILMRHGFQDVLDAGRSRNVERVIQQKMKNGR